MPLTAFGNVKTYAPASVIDAVMYVSHFLMAGEEVVRVVRTIGQRTGIREHSARNPRPQYLPCLMQLRSSLPPHRTCGCHRLNVDKFSSVSENPMISNAVHQAPGMFDLPSHARRTCIPPNTPLKSRNDCQTLSSNVKNSWVEENGLRIMTSAASIATCQAISFEG